MKRSTDVVLCGFDTDVKEGRAGRPSVGRPAYLLCCESEQDRRAWVCSINQALYSSVGGAIFGRRLSDTLLVERASERGLKVPQLVYLCVEFLRQHGLDTEGLFRLPGRSTSVKLLRSAFDRGERPALTPPTTDVHSVASLLKSYLCALPESLIPCSYYEPVMRIVQRELQLDPYAAILGLANIVGTLPRANYDLLEYLCRFLREVGRCAEVNRMSAMNLATLFCQSFIEPEGNDPVLLMGTAEPRTRATFVLISQVDLIFTKDPTPNGEVDAHGGVPAAPNVSQSTDLIDAKGSSDSQSLEVLDEADHPERFPTGPENRADSARDAAETSSCSSSCSNSPQVERRQRRGTPRNRAELTHRRVARLIDLQAGELGVESAGDVNEISTKMNDSVSVERQVNKRRLVRCQAIADDKFVCGRLLGQVSGTDNRRLNDQIRAEFQTDIVRGHYGVDAGRRIISEAMLIEQCSASEETSDYCQQANVERVSTRKEEKEERRSRNDTGRYRVRRSLSADAADSELPTAIVRFSSAKLGSVPYDADSEQDAKLLPAWDAYSNPIEIGCDELIECINSLQGKLNREREKVKYLTERMDSEAARHESQIRLMSEKLERENYATAEAVRRIAVVERQLELYCMKYGPLV